MRYACESDNVYKITIVVPHTTWQYNMSRSSPSMCPSTFTQIYHEYNHGASCVTMAPLIERVSLPTSASHSTDRCVCLVSSSLVVYRLLALQCSYFCTFVITSAHLAALFAQTRMHSVTTWDSTFVKLLPPFSTVIYMSSIGGRLSCGV